MTRALIRFSLAAIILLFVTACSTIKPLPVPYYSVPVDKNAVHKEEMSWWAYRYSITWPEEDERPNFAVDENKTLIPKHNDIQKSYCGGASTDAQLVKHLAINSASCFIPTGRPRQK